MGAVLFSVSTTPSLPFHYRLHTSLPPPKNNASGSIHTLRTLLLYVIIPTWQNQKRTSARLLTPTSASGSQRTKWCPRLLGGKARASRASLMRSSTQPSTRRMGRLSNKTPKEKARRIIVTELRAGRVKRQPCVVCGEKKGEAHQPNPNDPLCVVWLCAQHHKDLIFGNNTVLENGQIVKLVVR